MTRLDNLWRTLETRRDLAGVEIEWKRWLGDTYDALADFLTLDGRSHGYPRCETRGGLECTCRVIEREKNRFLAVCDFDDDDFPPIELKRTDVLLYRFGFTSLAKHLALVCGFQGVAGDEVPGLAQVRALGEAVGESGIRAAAYLVLPDPERGYATAFSSLLAGARAGALLFVVPTMDGVAHRDRSILEPRGAKLISCREIVTLDQGGGWTPVLRAPEIAARLWTNPPVLAEPADDREPIAVWFAHDCPVPRFLYSQAEVDEVVRRGQGLQHFVDGMGTKPVAYRDDGRARPRRELIAGEVAFLLAYLLRAGDGKEAANPRALSLGNYKRETRWDHFKNMRSKVDHRLRGQSYRLFQQGRSFEGGDSSYEFKPAAGVTWGFVFRPGAVSAMRKALTRHKK